MRAIKVQADPLALVATDVDDAAHVDKAAGPALHV
jgi:hypothetical protein